MKNTRSTLSLGSSKNYHTLGSAAWLVQELIKNSDAQPLGDEGDACQSKNL